MVYLPPEKVDGDDQIAAAREEFLNAVSLETLGRGPATLALSEVARLDAIGGEWRTTVRDRGWPQQPPALLAVTGLPRSGTTALQQLLAVAQPGRRTLTVAEAMGGGVPRFLVVQDLLAERRWQTLLARSPNFPAIHGLRTDDLEECAALLGAVYHSLNLGVAWPAPSYVEWLINARPTSAFRYLSAALRFIDPTADRWLVKSPQHICHLGSLFDVFPDARVVVCVRSPHAVVPSFASLVTDVRRASGLPVDRRAIGHEWLHLLSQVARRGTEQMLRYQDRVFVVDDAQLRLEPASVACNILAWAGDERPKGEAFESACDSTRRQQSTHRYSLEDFGLDGDMVVDAFRGTYVGY